MNLHHTFFVVWLDGHALWCCPSLLSLVVGLCGLCNEEHARSWHVDDSTLLWGTLLLTRLSLLLCGRWWFGTDWGAASADIVSGLS